MELNPILSLDVGGKTFKTLRETIMKHPQSTLARVITGKDPNNMIIIENTYFFDRNPDYFRVVLDYMRTGKIFLPSNLLESQLQEELKFWGFSHNQTPEAAIQPTLVTEETIQPTLVAEENIQPTLVAEETIQPTLIAEENIQPTLIADENIQPTLVAEETIQPTLVAEETIQPTLITEDQVQPTLIAENLNSTPPATPTARPPQEKTPEEDILTSLLPENSQPRQLPWQKKDTPKKAKNPTNKALASESSDFYSSDESFTRKKRKPTPKQPTPQKRTRNTRASKKSSLPDTQELEKALTQVESYKVMLSGYSPQDKKKLEKYINELGGTVVDSFSQNPNALVMEKYVRTLKFLEALNRGVEILGSLWVTDSYKIKDWQDTSKYLLCEENKEFNYKESIQKARKQKLLEGWKVWVSPHIKPSRSEVQELVQSAGAEVLKQEPNHPQEKLLVLSSNDLKDKRFNLNLKKRGFQPYNKELFLSGVLKQKLEFKEDYKL